MINSSSYIGFLEMIPQSAQRKSAPGGGTSVGTDAGMKIEMANKKI